MRRSVAFAVMLLASSAWAQDTSPEYVEARQRLQEGKTLYAQNNIDGARLKFEQACAVLKTPACLRALGLAQFYTGRYLEALPNLRRALEDRELKTDERKQITDLMQQAYDKTGHLEIHAPAGAHVSIDDTIDAGNAPLADEVHVTIGSHTISVQVEGRTERQTVECPEGKVTKVDFDHGVGGGQQQPPPGGGVVEETHTSLIPPTGAIITAAAGLVGLGLGIGFGVASGSANGTNVQNGPSSGGICAAMPSAAPCASAESTREAQQTDAVASTISYIAGGVLVAAGIIWWTVAPRKVRERRVTVLPNVGPRSAGIALGYTF